MRVATGARAAAPPIPGLADVASLTYEDLFSLTVLPPRLLIIGGGPVGGPAKADRRQGADAQALASGRNSERSPKSGEL